MTGDSAVIFGDLTGDSHRFDCSPVTSLSPIQSPPRKPVTGTMTMRSPVKEGLEGKRRPLDLSYNVYFWYIVYQKYTLFSVICCIFDFAL
jgi:hypothetical protein